MAAMINRTRVIPVLLLRDQGLVKTVQFKRPRYVGDPINSVRIFNEKEVDELIFLDISATALGRGPDFELLADISGEAFMPMAYGGGLASLHQVERVLALGFEKVVINSASYGASSLIADAVARFGSQSIVACLDARKRWRGGYRLYSHAGLRRQRIGLSEHLQQLVDQGVGEVMVQAIDRDGCQGGYDLELLRLVSGRVSVPVVGCGGAGRIEDFVAAVHDGGVSAVAAGSMFVFVGPHRAVLINYPDRATLLENLP